MAQGRPALARQRLSDLDVDGATRAALDGLLGACPILVGSLRAAKSNPYSLDRERHFVGSKAHVKRVSAFLDALSGPDSNGKRRR